MSIKNYNTTITIQNQNNGQIEVIHDLYKYNNEIAKGMLWDRLFNYLWEQTPISIHYGIERRRFI